MFKFTKTLALTATAIASLTIGTLAHAADDTMASAFVNVPDLTKPAGLDQANDSIRRAARHVCGLDNHEGLASRAAGMKCYAEAIAKASSHLDALLALQTSQKARQQALAGNTVVPTR